MIGDNDISNGWLDKSRFEKTLTSLKNHLIIDLEKLVHKKPSAISAYLIAITIFENPLAL